MKWRGGEGCTSSTYNNVACIPIPASILYLGCVCCAGFSLLFSERFFSGCSSFSFSLKAITFDPGHKNTFKRDFLEFISNVWVNKSLLSLQSSGPVREYAVVGLI